MNGAHRSVLFSGRARSAVMSTVRKVHLVRLRVLSTSQGESFCMSDVVKCASEHLPHQAILQRFVHHNPLHHLEHLHFDDALAVLQGADSFMSPTHLVRSVVHIDPTKRAREAISELSSAFLDLGAAKWRPPHRERGFLYFFASLEDSGSAWWRRHARTEAKVILSRLDAAQYNVAARIALSETIIQTHLGFYGVDKKESHLFLCSLLDEVRGWAGMFDRMESFPSEAPPDASVRLAEFCAVYSILARSSMSAVAKSCVYPWVPAHESFDEWLHRIETMYPLRSRVEDGAVGTVSTIASLDQDPAARESLEEEFAESVLGTLATQAPATTKTSPSQRPRMQLYSCIDDREGSIRRHIEELDPQGNETFGVAGFFGLPISYAGLNKGAPVVSAPENATPVAHVWEEVRAEDHSTQQKVLARRRTLARSLLKWERMTFSPVGSLLSAFTSPFLLARLTLAGFAPNFKRKIIEAVEKLVFPSVSTHLRYDIPSDTAARLLANVFRSVGAHQRFAPLVVLLGHGASSVNNPFAAAYNCGACSGREGGPNARLFARLANDPEVREVLSCTYNIDIPADTHFLGAQHNTTSDTMHFFDTDDVPPSNVPEFSRAQKMLHEACGRNALERCDRFLLSQANTPQQALEHVRTRSIDPAEVRPELNHATNAGVVIGRRELTKRFFYDRRVFLPSYDPMSDDARGSYLETVLAPALVVCSGINLEYLFSTTSVDILGAGTKVPLNITGNLGLLQGTSGDLRTGLPSQMTEMHVPLRALCVVDAPTSRVEAILARRPDLANLVFNEWIRLVTRDPESGKFFAPDLASKTFAEKSIDLVVYSDDKAEHKRESAPPAFRKTFEKAHTHGLQVARREDFIYRAAVTGLVASTVGPLYAWYDVAMNPYGPLIVLGAASLTLPIFAFSRRYLHGEYMFARIYGLSTALLLGFNMVAMAPSLEHCLAPWSLFGFASTFLIGSYNERPTVRNNATFAFAAYRVADFALLSSAALVHHNALFSEPSVVSGDIAALCLILAAGFKSSQVPLTSLFVRSMEGPTTTSALGYAGLSAHVGVILLSGTMDVWFDHDPARLALAAVGAATALSSSMVAHVRPDRKGAIAYATSSTLGAIMLMLACGYPELALATSFGHAALRINQILRSGNVISDSERVSDILGPGVHSSAVPEWMYHLSWRLRRLDTDFHALTLLHRISGHLSQDRQISRTQLSRNTLTLLGVILSGFPYTPLSNGLDVVISDLLCSHPTVALAIMTSHFGISVLTIRYLLLNTLTSGKIRTAKPGDIIQNESKHVTRPR
eukprot:TRINITY_DN467_c0_g1_i4.p1 TRINITY_DN467_c0_g1~~TRINITY_DN467_c0_g1_i4.p1  ORF type:complete len:1296 (-),score=96.04 TRINITY_DN467_c0_g1_i4:1026-4913(-)